MIDFRFFLISVIAVFLALGIGIVMGSGVLGGPILDGLERRADAVVQRNEDLRAVIANLETRQEQAQEFGSIVQSALVAGELTNENIVLIEAEGTDEDLRSSIEEVVEEAGGVIDTRIVLTDRFALEDEADRETLASLIDSNPANPAELRVDAGTELGSRLAASTIERSTDLAPGFARARAASLVGGLEDEGFAAVDRVGEEPLIPQDSFFIVAGGGEGDPPYDVEELLVPVAGRIDVRGAEALVAEGEDSNWGLVSAARADSEVSELISTVDHGDTVAGRISIVLSLGGDLDAGHWGTGDGAEAIVPPPTS